MLMKMPTEHIARVAEECGFTPFYIDKKVKEVQEVADKKALDISSSNILAGYDVQGPAVRLVDASFYPWIHVRNSLSSIYENPSVGLSIVSGWDLTSLRNFRDIKLGRVGKSMDIIGELGAVFEYEGQVHEINPPPKIKKYEMEQKLFEEVAEAGLKIAIQGNYSERVSDFYFEGDEPGRGDIKSHFLVKGKSVKTEDVHQSIMASPFDASGFSYDGRKIVFEPTLENVKIADYVLRHVHPLQSMRFSKERNKISMMRDDKDRHDFELKDMEIFAKEVIPREWEVDPNTDFCVDVIYKGDGIVSNKENAAHILAKKKFGNEKTIITNIGDKKGDVFTGNDTIFFPQMGTQSEEYCIKNNILHVPVISAIDYSLIIAEIANQKQEKRKIEVTNIIPLKL